MCQTEAPCSHKSSFPRVDCHCLALAMETWACITRLKDFSRKAIYVNFTNGNVQVFETLLNTEHMGFSCGSVVKNSLPSRRGGFDPRVEKIPRRRKWQLTLVFLPRKSHGQTSLAGYSLWGHKELDTTEGLNSNNTKNITVSYIWSIHCELASQNGWRFFILTWRVCERHNNPEIILHWVN